MVVHEPKWPPLLLESSPFAGVPVLLSQPVLEMDSSLTDFESVMLASDYDLPCQGGQGQN